MLFTFLNRRRFLIKTHWYNCAIISVVVGGKIVFTHQRVRRVLGFASGFKLVIQGPKLIWWGHTNRAVIHIKSRELPFNITCLLNHCQCGCNDENCWENLFIDNISLWTSRHVTLPIALPPAMCMYWHTVYYTIVGFTVCSYTVYCNVAR